MTRCAGCGRPPVACWCRFVVPVEVGPQVVVLQHPVEARHPLSTVPVLVAALAGTQVHRGVTFSPDLVPDGAVLLYPGGDEPDLLAPPRALVVLDGTWRHTRALLRSNPWLGALPTLGLRPAGRSRYPRTPTVPHGLSTLEAVALALVRLGEPPSVRDALLRPFTALVGMHQACADGGGSHVLTDQAALVRAGYLPGG